MLKKYKQTALLILDGWGHGANPKVSAIAQAKTPFINSLYQRYPNSELVTYGEEVGLPEGQMGNSEVGHLNIGAGRIVYQELVRINKAAQDHSLHENKILVQALEYAKANNKAVHFMGLLSDGGVHSHINHLKALCDATQENGLSQVYIHAFMDGRDTAPNGGLAYLQNLLDHIEDSPIEVASIIGRYYAMDRDKRWERIKLAYDLLLEGKGTKFDDPIEALKASYANGVTDEFIEPVSCSSAKVQEGDVVICFNFRTDRCRQITTALTQEDFPTEGMKSIPLHYVTMTRYDDSFEQVGVLFEKDNLKNTLGEVLAKAGKTQVRIAETEKYPHVTFFFSGGRETEFEQEKRLIVASPKVATYDLQPEMSAIGITDTIIAEVEANQPNFICLNYANADMVGHTGVFEAAIKAAETVDTCVERLVQTLLQHDYGIIIIADHGNSDYMINDDGSPHTAHTVNPVPCFFVANEVTGVSIKDGKLADVAPTLLQLMQLEPSEEMNGTALLS
ncbi:2,3-bisphosphoglycerate-independent phosphoglycerate mutase [Aureispira anguillae]|uniref:2,3-bisphosphoglycerate-independent phosphoglycerate mutase n=1 Tax=Aureispira anguillae TaxID=2864201 RepID=A0A915YG27_9BACT|nr:2,3-bisphosphoglycerate-independent phosphoglycerate mutase [Aureispira anguillae]BDS12497.1 2,3-bisphosphoglycerate-independent phosphoglycerate mutase [Aureispira anguillae]